MNNEKGSPSERKRAEGVTWSLPDSQHQKRGGPPPRGAETKRAEKLFPKEEGRPWLSFQLPLSQSDLRERERAGFLVPREIRERDLDGYSWLSTGLHLELTKIQIAGHTCEVFFFFLI